MKFLARWICSLCVLLLVAPTSAAEPSGKLDIVFVGDIMLDELPGKAIERSVDPFAEFAPIFKAADVTVGNLECVVATTGTAEDKPYTFRAHPRVIPVLKKHFTAVSVANNHSGDFGRGALVEQCELFEKAGLPYFGGGRDLKAAHTPLVIERNGLRLALLGYNEFQPRRFAAGEKTPGIAWSVDELVVADLKAAREKHKADLVIPYMHWGWENEEVNERQQKFARTMIDAGADAVIGAHPHVRQNIDYYKGRLIVYSLGNFVFNDFDKEEQLTTWVLRISLDRKGMVSWDTKVAKLDDQGLPHLDPKTRGPSGKRGDEKIADYHPPYPKPSPEEKAAGK